jgi:hypothetical protein
MRKTSDVNDVDFPFADDRVPFILVLDGAGPEHRGFEHASTKDKKVKLLEAASIRNREAGHEDYVLACWPGAKRTDVFHVDDLDEALAAFG